MKIIQTRTLVLSAAAALAPTVSPAEAAVPLDEPEPRPITLSTAPDGMWAIEAALGVEHMSSHSDVAASGRRRLDSAVMFGLVHGLSDRWEWRLPLAFAYRSGERGGVEWIPAAGVFGLGIGYSSLEGMIFDGRLGAGATVRSWIGRRSSLEVGLMALSPFSWAQNRLCVQMDPCPSWRAPTTVEGWFSTAYAVSFGDAVTLVPALGVGWNVLSDGELPPPQASAQDLDFMLALGSVHIRGLRPQPLVRVHFSDVFSLDGHAAVAYSFARRGPMQSYLVGASWIW